MRQSERGSIVAPIMVGLGLIGIGSIVFVVQDTAPMIPLWGVLGPILGFVLLLLVWVVRSVRDYALDIKGLKGDVEEVKGDAKVVAAQVQKLYDWKYEELAPKVIGLVSNVERLKGDAARILRQLESRKSRIDDEDLPE